MINNWWSIFLKFKKNFFRLQELSAIKNDIEIIIGKSQLRLNQEYSNQYLLNNIYDNEVVFYFIKRTEIFYEILKYIQAKNLNFYLFTIDKNNIYPEGLYLVINEHLELLKNRIVPDVEQLIILKNNDNNDFFFPFQISIKEYLGISKRAEMIFLRDFFSNVSRFYEELKNKKNINYIAFQLILLLFEEEDLVERKDKATLLSDSFIAKAYNIHGSFSFKQSELGIFLLKQKYERTFSQDLNFLRILSKKEILNSYMFGEDLKGLIEKFNYNCSFILKEEIKVQYAFLNMVLNIFQIKDYHKAYIFFILNKHINYEI